MRGRTDGLRYIEVGKPGALSSHEIEVGRADRFGALAAHVRVAHVICHDEDDVRSVLVCVKETQWDEENECEKRLHGGAEARESGGGLQSRFQPDLG